MLSQSRLNEGKRGFARSLATNPTCRKRVRKWDCKLLETLIGNYLIVPLTSAKMLKSEGYLMNSGCREYTDECVDQKYTIFSIRSRSGERLATLGLVYDEDYWQVDQCLGPANKEVMEEISSHIDENGMLHTEVFATELYYVAHEVGRLMNSSANTQ